MVQDKRWQLFFLLNEIKASDVGNKQITASERKWVWDVM